MLAYIRDGYGFRFLDRKCGMSGCPAVRLLSGCPKAERGLILILNF